MSTETKQQLFLELAGPVDADGFSRRVEVTEFVGKYSVLRFGNGGSWCRTDSPLGRRFNVVRHKGGGGNSIVAVELQGYRLDEAKGRPIAAWIRRRLKGKACAVLGVGAGGSRFETMAVDHKNGRYNDARVLDVETQTLDDFQLLTACANYAKRQHCKRCVETGQRFDARTLGHRAPVCKGSLEYHGTCVGCYWHDPRAFNAAMELADTPPPEPEREPDALF